MTFTGVAGGADLRLLPFASVSDFTLQYTSPHKRASPTFRVPRSTMTEALGPRPTCTCDSMTIPLTGQVGLACNSRTSACSKIISKRSSMLVPFKAETSTAMVSPPQSSGAMPFSCICCLTRSTLAPLASILLIATTIALFASLANFRASSVCGLKASSAATTRTAISVMLAPRSRINEKAACPGVSMKEIFCPLCSIW